MKNIVHIAKTNSTNDLLKQALSAGEKLPNGHTIWADYQTAGRGQQGNGWESEDSKNLLFTTLLLDLEVTIDKQFAISELVTLAIVNVLNRKLKLSTEKNGIHTQDTDEQEEVTVKWPNDIYWKDKKLAGILIENNLLGGRIASSIVGVGLNVNQEVFTSNAPNPISLKQITGCEWDREQLLSEIIDEIGVLRTLFDDLVVLKDTYMKHLYRRTGLHWWKENICSSEPVNILQGAQEGMFEASIRDVEDNGLLVLKTAKGETKKYHFKEIKYVLNQPS